MFGEQQAFEKAIDANPLEATNHHAYADWLEENGQHDEAAFRRAIGDWVLRTPNHLPIKWSDDYAYPWTVDTQRTPEGVKEFDLPRWYPGDPETTQVDPDSGINGPIDPIQGRPQGRGWHHHLQWKTYRHMERALRQAFMRNRPQKQSRKPLSRLKFFRK